MVSNIVDCPQEGGTETQSPNIKLPPSVPVEKTLSGRIVRWVILRRSKSVKVVNAGISRDCSIRSESIFALLALSDGITGPPSGRRKTIAKQRCPVTGQKTGPQSSGMIAAASCMFLSCTITSTRGKTPGSQRRANRSSPGFFRFQATYALAPGVPSSTRGDEGRMRYFSSRITSLASSRSSLSAAASANCSVNSNTPSSLEDD
jgi:hypothetical protein